MKDLYKKYKVNGKSAKPGDLLQAFRNEVGNQKGAKANRLGLLAKKRSKKHKSGIKCKVCHKTHGKEVKHKAHPGFKSVQSRIAKNEGISKDRAGAILASASRNASKGAKRANPRLNRVKGKKKLKDSNSK